MPGPARGAAVLACLLVLSASTALAQTKTRADCEAAYPANWGRAGKDVPWVPSLDAVAFAMLTIGQVGPQDLVYDLGAGDGRVVITAARPPFGARAVGIEYDPMLAKRAACLVEAEGVADRVKIVQGDIFKEDFSPATVVTMFLLPHLNLCVRHRLLALKPGTHVVSHQYSMADWDPDGSVEIQGRHVFMWVVPARVDGAWDLRGEDGEEFAIDLHQTFSKLTGEVVQGRERKPLQQATLRGAELRFAFDRDGASVEFAGTVQGGEIAGNLSTGPSADTVGATGRLRGSLRPAPWAAMRPGCERYYGP
jgi:SAM-dependent methyltransferase